MSIQEALGRVVPRKVEISEAERQRKLWSLGETRRSFGADYREIVLEAGRSIHREAGVPELLEELVEIIKPNFSDVKIEETVEANGAVSSKIVWNRKDILEKPFGDRYNSVEIIAHPLTKDLVVEGREAFEIFPESQWKSDPKLLEDAIARAYRNSDVRGGSRIRINPND